MPIIRHADSSLSHLKLPSHVLGYFFPNSITLMIILKQDTDRFTMVNTSDGLGKHSSNIQNLKLVTLLLVNVLSNAVGDDHVIKSTSIDSVDSVTAQDTMTDESIDLLGTFTLEELCGARDSVRGVGKIVDEDGCLADNVTNKDHRRVFTGLDNLRGPPLL